MCAAEDDICRTLQIPAEESTTDIHSGGSLALRVCVRTYKLFYVSNTEDYIWRSVPQDRLHRAQQSLKAQDRRQREWLEKFLAREPVTKPEDQEASPATPPA